MKNSYNFIDLTGKQFGRLTVIEFGGTVNGRTYWECRCYCGKLTRSESYSLRKGTKKSCGCLRKEITAKRNTKLITSHGMSNTRFYRIWQHMRNRCQNKNNHAYSNYGGRGITVYSKWNKFENFYNDMFNEYQKHLSEFGEHQTTIDRTDNNKGYSKDNCRWATYKEQSSNQSYSSELRSKAGKLGAIARWGK